MSTVEITAGSTEPLEVYARAAAGGALTGSSNLRVQIRRVADGHFLDFSDGAFKSTGWTTRQAALAEIDSTNAPGEYRLSGGLGTVGWNAGSYAVTFLEVSTSLVANGPQFATGEIRIVAATPSTLSTNLDVAVSTRLAANAYTAAPSAAAVAAQVWATAEGTPSSGTYGYALWVLRQGLTNRLDEAAGNPGTLKLYRDDGSTVLFQWQLRDSTGGAVTAQSGSPARRGAAST